MRMGMIVYKPKYPSVSWSSGIVVSEYFDSNRAFMNFRYSKWVFSWSNLTLYFNEDR